MHSIHYLWTIYFRRTSLHVQKSAVSCTAYSTPSALLIGVEIISSSSGVQHGEPHGPLLFALTVNDIAHSVGTPHSIWYRNDATMGGPSESVIEPYPKIVADHSSIGLDVNTSMTEVISYCTGNLKIVVHSLRDIGIVPVDDSEHLRSPLFAGAICCIINDETEKLKLATERLMQIVRHIALLGYGTVSQSVS